MVKRRTPVRVPDRGDVVRIDLDPSRGHEQAKWRPALVLSPKSYNLKTGLMIACPITSRSKGYPFEVSLRGVAVRGVVLSDQVRALDWKTRGAQYVETADILVLAEVQAKLTALIQG